MTEINGTNERMNCEKHKVRNDISTVAWAFVLLWAGLTYLAENLGYLQRWISSIPGLPEKAYDMTAFSVVFLGAGVIFFIEAILRIVLPGQGNGFTGTIILAAVGIGVGLGNIISWSLVGPIILIAIGLSFLLRGLVSR